jgi:hypothetical protein
MYLDGEGVKGRILTPPGPTGEGRGRKNPDPCMYLDGEGVKGRVLTPPGPTGEGRGRREES